MRIDVSGLLKARTGETRTYRIENWELEAAEGAPRELVSGVTTLMRTQAGVLAAYPPAGCVQPLPAADRYPPGS